MTRRRALLARLGEERGIAVITAMIVSMVVLSLGLVVLQLATHNVDASSYDRKRVQSVHSGEAGLDAYLASLPRTPTDDLRCSMSGTLPITPSAEYDVTVRFYSTYPSTASEHLMPCDATGTLPPGPRPEGAVIESRGTAIAEGSSRAVTRTMQTQVRLSPIYGVFDHAIYSDTAMAVENRMVLNGHQANDGDVYTNGDFVMGNNTEIFGSVYAQGKAVIDQGIVHGDVWARKQVELHNIDVFGNVTSSEPVSGVTNGIVLNNARVGGTAKSATGILVPTNSRAGAEVRNSPSPPPPTRPLVQLAWDAATQGEYTAAGYTIQNYSTCADARNFVTGNTSTAKFVVRLTDPSQCPWSKATVGSDTVNVHGDLSIVTDGPMDWSGRITFQGVGETRNLFIIRPYVVGRICPSDSGWPNLPAGSYDFEFGNLSRFENLNVFVYTQCYISFANNNSTGFNGQLIGGRVAIRNNMTFNYRPVLVPGANVTGYRMDIAFIREIANVNP